MELWIRSQDKHNLIKAEDIKVVGNAVYIEQPINYLNCIIGSYKTEARALEVLDDIAKRIKNSYIVEVKPLLTEADLTLIEETLNIKYDGEFIMQPQQTEIKPINSNLIYYEMPKE